MSKPVIESRIPFGDLPRSKSLLTCTKLSYDGPARFNASIGCGHMVANKLVIENIAISSTIESLRGGYAEESLVGSKEEEEEEEDGGEGEELDAES